MWSLTLIKSASRFVVPMCLMVTLAITTDELMAQGRSELSCREIAIVGSVKAPGRFQLPARMRLIEVLARVGGPSERAGKVVRVTHFCQCSHCAEGEVRMAAGTEYNLSAALAGKEDANPYVGAGDVIIVAEAELIFVIGDGLSKTLVYREGVTLTQGIAPLDGARYSDLTRVRIHRNSAASPRPTPIIFTLKAVLDKRTEDPVLQPRDIIEISDETGNFRSPLRPIFRDSPLMRPTGEPPLIQRRSSNC